MQSCISSPSPGPEPRAALICPLFLCSTGVGVPAGAFLPVPQGKLRVVAYAYPPCCLTLPASPAVLACGLVRLGGFH